LERIGGIQAQYAPAMYVGLWSRLDGFEREHLTSALERRTVVQGTLQRVTIHLVSAGDYWPFALAVREERRRWWLGATRGAHQAGDLAEAAERVRAHLHEHGPVRRKELDALVGKERAIGVGLWVDLVRVPPSGTWERRRADLFGLAEDWLGPPPPELEAEAAAAQVVRRYLSGFGPATVAEIANWAGLRTPTVAAAVAGVRGLRHLGAQGGDELVDLPRAPRPDPDTPAPVRFLPTWDATLLVHARRAVILPEEYRPRIFNTKMPQSVSTFLVDGQVAGTWRYDGDRVLVDPFRPLPAGVRAEVDAEAERIAAFHA
jgi:Winged helix DNA-binding domain